jgi:hypothetical protein
VTVGAQTEDAWDRLAALAFGGAPSAGGCSEHAHDLECTCLADHEPDAQRPADPADELPVHADPETEAAD